MVIATGFFDGVHLGHRHVLGQLVKEARDRGDESMVVTFWPHPRNVLQDDARNLRLLTSLSEKKEILLGLGVDRVEVLPFTRAFSRLTTEEYFREYIIGRFGGKAVLIGYDNRVGSDLLTPDEIEAVARRTGLEVIRTDSVSIPGGIVVSSTKIREAISSGDVETAASMLGYEYSLTGVVVAGNRLGRTIGFPTANMRLYEPLKLLPGNGVYSVEVESLGRRFRGMCNIGTRPTVNAGTDRTVETNIFGFDEDIYGLDLKVTFLRKIREERRFSSLDELKAQLEHDRKVCLEA
ncbi:MAG: riboflavin biosynthesis protein RibF [Bacteroidales bacterium]|nr:riboflavin biosynthesis protein RibF [Bacteroidales bacterium]MBQ6185059.1 riboflavin biosynthesis protein RibF [Bacteroidales bacterium]